jgi:hypothetical protein
VNTKEKKDLFKFFATGFRFVIKMPSFRAHSVRFFTPEPKEINCIAHWLAYVLIDFSGGFERQNKFFFSKDLILDHEILFRGRGSQAREGVRGHLKNITDKAFFTHKIPVENSSALTVRKYLR